jgi:BlaI family transcriptional regulator, penicillinase repressor
VPEARTTQLSRRERQIMYGIYRKGSATAAEVREALPEPPSYSAVRALLRILEAKGHLTHAQDGPRYVYKPVVPRHAARQSALRQVVKTFFGGSTTAAVATLLDMSTGDLSDQEVEQLVEMIDRAKREGR